MTGGAGTAGLGARAGKRPQAAPTSAIKPAQQEKAPIKLQLSVIRPDFKIDDHPFAKTLPSTNEHDFTRICSVEHILSNREISPPSPLPSAGHAVDPRDAKMVSRIVFWAGFGMPYYCLQGCTSSTWHTEKKSNGQVKWTGIATRVWQLGLQKVNPLSRSMLWAYPVFAGVGASFGYWLDGVDKKQVEILQERKEAILAKRARRAAREGQVEAA